MEQLLEKIEGELAAGYQRIKMKIKPGWDVEPIAALRRAYGDIPLMADANSSYTLDQLDVFKQLDRYGLTMIEQPLAHDDIVDHAQEWADLAAERIVALGLPVDARLSTVAAKTSTPELSEGFQQSDRTIAEVIALIDAASASVNTAVDELDELDQTSQDIAIEIARGLDKDRWFLFAHLSR